jgi:hypothetical protein
MGNWLRSAQVKEAAVDYKGWWRSGAMAIDACWRARSGGGGDDAADKAIHHSRVPRR